jgi:hypothetical protein
MYDSTVSLLFLLPSFECDIGQSSEIQYRVTARNDKSIKSLNGREQRLSTCGPRTISGPR